MSLLRRDERDDTPTGPMTWDGPLTMEFVFQCRSFEETACIPALKLTVAEYRAIREGRAEIVGDVREGMSVRYREESQSERENRHCGASHTTRIET